MSERDKHLKASDVFAQSDFLFGQKTSDFSKAFPDIQEVRATVVEEGEDVSQRAGTRHYSQHNIGEYINCHNPRCYNGGFSIGAILRLMEATRQTEGEFHEFCQGYEGSPKGRKNYGPCDNEFRISLTVTYKDES